ncbi:putative antibiotic biosynthesis monooxygenase protein [Botrytis fragariae]|uniref:Putative antibiotic biosynthesis monooxygenase protein n=1 Tax=Botrytis fragariae TaxID=1964551 RepID=A0A8H6B3B0_9HELO|nr:putative antibiotic biosynthesis monooxygenase protein [Botrytis fragariae]KAF5878589.1 putative antibiotic biosynthesis monooxygenase protein [Botrytis fragariae]
MSEEIQVIAIFHPTPGKENRLQQILLDLASKVRENEQGVKKYQAFEQIDSQSGSNVVLFQETFTTHLSSPYFTSTGEILAKEELITKPFEVIVLNPIGGFTR